MMHYSVTVLAKDKDEAEIHSIVQIQHLEGKFNLLTKKYWIPNMVLHCDVPEQWIFLKNIDLDSWEINADFHKINAKNVGIYAQ
jgi:hypothetical protein